MPQISNNSRNSISSSRSLTADLKNSAFGDSSLRLNAKVQFLDNKVRPAGFTEFFLVKNDLNTILANESIQVPSGIGIESPAEYWARSVQRGYRFPGIAAKIRNALAGASLMRIKPILLERVTFPIWLQEGITLSGHPHSVKLVWCGPNQLL